MSKYTASPSYHHINTPTGLYHENKSLQARSQNWEKRLIASPNMPVRPCVHLCRMEKLDSHWTDFHEILYLSVFRKSVKKIQVSLTSDKNHGHLKDGQYTFFIYLAQFFLEWEIFRTKVVNKIKTHILRSITFLLKSCCIRHNVGKFCSARQVINDNIVQAHCMLDT